MRRPRGPGGRFLTAEEIAAQQKAAESSDSTGFHPNPNPSAEERKALKASSDSATAAAAAAIADSTRPANEFRAFTEPTSSTAPATDTYPSGQSTQAPYVAE